MNAPKYVVIKGVLIPLIIMCGAIFDIFFENSNASFMPTTVETMPNSDVEAPIMIILSV